MNYQLAFIEHDYDTYTIAVEEEYENEKKQLIENLLSSLQEKKKQAKEEDEDGGRTKRSLRKRNLESSTATLKSDPITSNKKRAGKNNRIIIYIYMYIYILKKKNITFYQLSSNRYTS
jgi:carbonic anhydrase